MYTPLSSANRIQIKSTLNKSTSSLFYCYLYNRANRAVEVLKFKLQCWSVSGIGFPFPKVVLKLLYTHSLFTWFEFNLSISSLVCSWWNCVYILYLCHAFICSVALCKPLKGHINVPGTNRVYFSKHYWPVGSWLPGPFLSLFQGSTY